MERVNNCIALLGILLAFAGNSFGISYVQEIQIPAYQRTEVVPGLFTVDEPTAYYHTDLATPYFQLKPAMSATASVEITNAAVKLFNDADYYYRFSGMLTVGPSNFIQNKANPYWQGHSDQACGEFEGGFTMTVVGDLWHVSNPGTLLAENETILAAVNNQATWDLYEFDSYDPPSYNDVVANPSFDTETCFLDSGNWSMPDSFDAYFSFPDSGTTQSGNDVTDFGTTNSYEAEIPVIQISLVPEPTSLVLLAASAGICIFRRRTKQ